MLFYFYNYGKQKIPGTNQIMALKQSEKAKQTSVLETANICGSLKENQNLILTIYSFLLHYWKWLFFLHFCPSLLYYYYLTF